MFLSIVIVIIPLAMAILAGHMQTKNKKFLIPLWAMALSCALLIGFQGWRIYQTQTQALESQNELKTLMENQSKGISNLRKEITEKETQIAKLTQEQLDIQKKRLYEPSVAVIYEDKKLKIINKGQSNLFLWGINFLNSYEIWNEPRVIATHTMFYFNMAALKKDAEIESNPNPPVLPLEIYLKNALQEKYTIKCLLIKRKTDGLFRINTQMLGIEPSNW